MKATSPSLISSQPPGESTQESQDGLYEEKDDSSNHPAPCALESAHSSHTERNGDDKPERAIQLSRQAAVDDEAHRQAQEEKELKEALRLSVAESKKRDIVDRIIR